MEAIDRDLLAGRLPVLAFLPTAAGQEEPGRVDYWLRLGAEHARRLGVEPVPVPVLDRADAQRADLADRLAGAGLIYLSGGSPAYLVDTLRDTAVLDAIVASWQVGAALAGCSAGAAALSEVAHDLLVGAAVSGLGLVAGIVAIPHFDVLERWAPVLIDRARASPRQRATPRRHRRGHRVRRRALELAGPGPGASVPHGRRRSPSPPFAGHRAGLGRGRPSATRPRSDPVATHSVSLMTCFCSCHESARSAVARPS
jgi:hypothetical protein